MVINQGLFATERGKTVIEDSLKQASTPLTVDGTIFLNSTGANVTGIVIPLKAYGVKYVALGANETAVTLKVGDMAWPNVYNGIAKIDSFINFTALYETVSGGLNATKPVNATLFIQNSNAPSGSVDSTLDSNEKGYLVIALNPTVAAAPPRAHIVVEIRPEKASPLTVEFYVPESLPEGWITVAG
jgi:archaellin